MNVPINVELTSAEFKTIARALRYRELMLTDRNTDYKRQDKADAKDLRNVLNKLIAAEIAATGRTGG